MKKKRTGAVKAGKLSPKKKTKRVLKAKGGRVGATAGFTLKVSGKLAKTLATVAENDKAFKGANPQRYAINVLKKTAAI